MTDIISSLGTRQPQQERDLALRQSKSNKPLSVTVNLMQYVLLPRAERGQRNTINS